MSDEDSGLPARSGEQDGELLLYDFFKHLTSLSILTLGGVLVVAQSADPVDVKRWIIVAVLICVSVSGIISFTASSEIARARSTGTPVKPSIQWSRKIAPLLLALGVGIFLSVFVDTID